MKHLYATLLLWPLLYACSNNKDKQLSEGHDMEDYYLYRDDVIVGNWDVQWEMTGEEVAEYSPEKRMMQGKMSFLKSGEVEVTTYGYQGCLFMQDTSTNIMNWKLENQVLRFMDKKDIHGIPYNIEKMGRNEIKLSIMENIHLVLKRKK